MTATATDPTREASFDVAVVGGGLAGLATAVHVARRGARVVCVEPRPWPRPSVGESLEFSAAGLLAALGIDAECRGGRPPLYPKTSVAVTGPADAFTVWPPVWFARPPISCSRVAYHTDRAELDHLLLGRAIEHGVEILPGRVAHVDHEGDVISALITDERTRITATWYIDATGHTTRLLGRALDLDVELLGRPRVAYWARLDAPPEGHATRLSFAGTDDLAWVWEIPLNASEVSIGTVMSAAALTTLRGRGLRPREIFEHQLGSIPRLHRIVADHGDVDLHATAYTPYRHLRAVGPNWLLVGDASGMVDPLTSNGVTSALRHADLAASTVTRALDRGLLTRRHAWAYQNTAPATITTIEAAMEAFLYRPDVRRRHGLRWAVALYAATGVITNSWYARIGHTTVPRSVACATMLAFSRLWTRLGRSAVLRAPMPRRGEAGSRPSAPRRHTAPAGATIRERRPIARAGLR